MKKIKYFLNIRKLPFRFLLLLFSVGSGIGLVWVGADKIYYFFDSILAMEIKSNYSFIALLLGILTFLKRANRTAGFPRCPAYASRRQTCLPRNRSAKID